jgi:hypothetical protein
VNRQRTAALPRPVVALRRPPNAMDATLPPIPHLRERMAIARMLMQLLELAQDTAAQLAPESRPEPKHLMIALAVFLGHATRRPMSVYKIAISLRMSRSKVARATQDLIKWGIIEPHGRSTLRVCAARFDRGFAGRLARYRRVVTEACDELQAALQAAEG